MLAAISLIFGLVRWPWWTAFVPAAAALGLEVLAEQKIQENRRLLGLDDGGYGSEWMFIAAALMIVVSFACYWAGRGLRRLFSKKGASAGASR